MIASMTMTPNEPVNSLTWDEHALVSPHDDKAKAARVNRMFDAIAESYDLNNRVHSLWRDQAWRKKAVRLAQVRPGEDVVVDVACGTGDLTLAFHDAGPAGVIGIDFVPRMIDLARRKAERRAGVATADADADMTGTGTGPGTVGERSPSAEGALRQPEFRVGDAEHLDLPDASADIVSIAFGIRNVADPNRALREFRRVLRPGGRVVILEFSLPRNPVLRLGYHVYFNHVLPRTATLLSRDRTGAYKYLPRSVNTFLDRESLCRSMREAGFVEITRHPMTFGICVAYLGRVPSGAAS